MNDTIVAISTALGVGAISIVRLSGKDAISIVNNCFNGKDLTKVKTHTINYGFIKDNESLLLLFIEEPLKFVLLKLIIKFFFVSCSIKSLKYGCINACLAVNLSSGL